MKQCLGGSQQVDINLTFRFLDEVVSATIENLSLSRLNMESCFLKSSKRTFRRPPTAPRSRRAAMSPPTAG
jgi:hypothetical protein